MKKMLHTLAAVLVALTAQAQTLNVSVGSVTDQYPSAQTGEMTFTGGTQMTVMGKTYDISQIGKMWTDQTQVKDNEVNVVYSGDAALVYVAGNIARYVTATVSGAHVNITQSDAITNDLINDGTFSEITYNLSGASTDGSLTLGGTAKCTVAVNGLELTNPNGAPINITNGKRVDLSVKKGSTNTLKDGTASTAKASLYCKGHLELKGKGTLNVYAYGSAAHGIKSGDYMEMKNCTVNILAATKDGVSCNEYFLMESGELNISGTGDDGIQCDLDGTTSTGELTDHEDEDTGNIYLEGGTISIAVTADAAKGVKASGDVRISDGNITVKATGNAVWDTDDSEVKGSSCISADGNMTISGGTLVLTNSGSGGKGIKADGTLTISDAANIGVTTTGQIAYCSSTTNTTIRTTTSSNTTERLDDALHTSPKGIKADGAMTITGGTINVSATYHEAIETKGTLDIKGGYIYAYSGDDAINSKSTMNISGGYIMANSSGNDGLDANGNLNITGGTVVAVSASGAEVGIDAAEQYKLNITGGNIIAIGGLERGYTMNGTAYQAASYNKGAWYGFYDNSGQLITAFKVPSNSNMGSPMVVYTSTGKPSVMSGVTGSGDSFWNGNGYSSCSGGTSVSLTTYTSSSGGGGGGGRPGR